jgi:hypothetical protein
VKKKAGQGMTVTTETGGYSVPDDIIAAAREYIRSEHGCVVFVGEVLDELSDKFGDRFRVSADMHKVVELIEALWAEPNLREVTAMGCISFAWVSSTSDTQ